MITTKDFKTQYQQQSACPFTNAHISHMHTYTHIHTRACMHTHTHTCTHTHTHTHTRLHTLTHACTRTHKHTQTHNYIYLRFLEVNITKLSEGHISKLIEFNFLHVDKVFTDIKCYVDNEREQKIEEQQRGKGRETE